MTHIECSLHSLLRGSTELWTSLTSLRRRHISRLVFFWRWANVCGLRMMSSRRWESYVLISGVFLANLTLELRRGRQESLHFFQVSFFSFCFSFAFAFPLTSVSSSFSCSSFVSSVFFLPSFTCASCSPSFSCRDPPRPFFLMAE